MSGSGCEALPDILEGSGDTSGCPGVVESPSRKFGRPAQRSGNGWDTLPNVPEGWVALPNVREWLRDLPRYAGVFGSPFQMSRSGQETLPDVREWSGDPPGCPRVVGGIFRCPGVVERPSQILGVVGRHSRVSWSCHQAFPDVRK